MAKNFLLGYGEELISDMARPDSGPVDKFFYSYEENKALLLPKLKELKAKFKRLPSKALTNGEVVGRITLHPTHLAKSYYPQSFLSKFKLKDIGGKEVKLSPRKVGTKKKKDSYLCTSLYVSVNENSLSELINTIENDRLLKTHQLDFCKIEDISSFEGEDKILSFEEEDAKYEFVIHTPELENLQVLKQFKDYSSECGCQVDYKKGVSTGGLSFLSVNCDKSTLDKLSEFTYLRAIRIMPELGVHRPVTTRSKLQNKNIVLPNKSAANQSVKVAIFDGGIGTADISKWTKEFTFTNETSVNSLLSHGSEVTSLVLFGNIEDDQDELPVPFSNIDHYRVVDPSIDSYDLDCIDILRRIMDVLEKNHYDFVNLSLGPRCPIEDNEVHSWTSVLESFLESGKTLMSVAVGNDGKLDDELSRVQVPSDMVNALAVGAASSDDDDFWTLADYSSIGPGRSPGLVKPDVVANGGSDSNPLKIYSPLTGGITLNAGTSFAAPLALRQAIAIKASLEQEVTPLVTKSLLIHSANSNSHPWQYAGWGKIRSTYEDVLFTEDNEATVIYRREILSGKYIRAQVPLPNINDIGGRVYIKATFCYATKTDPQHPHNYTRSGLSVVFRPFGSGKETQTFFSSKSLYPRTEEELRKEGHKWENTLSNEISFDPSELSNPCFEINHQEREGGAPAKGHSLPFVLILTVRAENTPKLYDAIVQKYQVLQPLRTRTQVPIPLR